MLADVGETVYFKSDTDQNGTTATLNFWGLEAVPEDDDHLLMVADSGEGTPSAIIHCAISTGACELATPLTKTARYEIRLLGAWS